jgi:putative sterol carrier protein
MSDLHEVQKIFNKLPEAFIPEKAAGLKANIQVNLSGNSGGDWFLAVANDQMIVTPGVTPAPDLTLGLTTEDFVSLMKGQANPMALFMGGRIKVEGNLALATKFQSMFDRNRVVT